MVGIQVAEATSGGEAEHEHGSLRQRVVSIDVQRLDLRQDGRRRHRRRRLNLSRLVGVSAYR